MGSGFEDLIKQEVVRRNMLDRELTNAPFEVNTFSVEAMRMMQSINSCIKEITAGRSIEDDTFAVRKYLDSLRWKHIFTSGEVNKRTDRDSRYYMTDEGASLRLKMFNVEKTGDIRRVVQPFMERIVFEDSRQGIYDEPRVGLTVMEYLSKEFSALQYSSGIVRAPFVSRVKVYNTNNGRVVKPPQDIFHIHTGNEVNSIVR